MTASASWTLAALVAVQAAQAPAFKSGVELVVVDVQVVDGRGYPIESLTPDAFNVTIDGHVRRVVSAELTKYAAGQTAGAVPNPAAAAPPAPSETASAPKASRIFVIAVDETSFAPLQVLAAMIAASQFIDHLEPQDYVGAYAYPTGTLEMSVTRDHEKAKKDLERVAGLFDPPISRLKIGASEVIDIKAGDRDVMRRVVERECGRSGGAGCNTQVSMEVDSLSKYFETQTAMSLAGLRNIIQSLATVPGRKTLVVVSGGLIASDRIGAQPNIGLEAFGFAHDAAAGNVNMYVLHMDNSFLDSYSVRTAMASADSQMRDSGLASLGLELVAGATGGSLVHVEGTQPERAFDRVTRETSAYYLLGVEPADADRDGKSHAIRVAVKQRGASVRSRASVTIPAVRK